MGSLVYIRLIGCTFGTLLQLFWMVVILGYRRQPPVALNQFAIGTISIGLCLLPALLLHLHMEYAETRGLRKNKRWKLAVLILFYAACLHLVIRRIPVLMQDPQF